MEVVSSFFDNIKQKTTNPFFGTLICVWLVRNWALVYSLFTFEESTTLHERKAYVVNYYKHRDLGVEFFKTIGWTLFFLIVGYFFIILSRLLINLVYHRIIPYFNNFIDRNQLVVDSKRFDIVKKTRDEYFTQIIELKESLVSLEQKNSLLKTETIEKDSNIANLQSANASLSNINEVNADVIRIKETKIANLENENKLHLSQLVSLERENANIGKANKNLNDRISQLEFNEESVLLENNAKDYKTKLITYDYKNYEATIKYTLSNDIGETIHLLKKKDLLSYFYETSYRILNYGAIQNDNDNNKYLSDLNLLKPISVDNKRAYALTDFGTSLYKFKNIT